MERLYAGVRPDPRPWHKRLASKIGRAIESLGARLDEWSWGP